MLRTILLCVLVTAVLSASQRGRIAADQEQDICKDFRYEHWLAIRGQSLQYDNFIEDVQDNLIRSNSEFEDYDETLERKKRGLFGSDWEEVRSADFADGENNSDSDEIAAERPSIEEGNQKSPSEEESNEIKSSEEVNGSEEDEGPSAFLRVKVLRSAGGLLHPNDNIKIMLMNYQKKDMFYFIKVSPYDEESGAEDVGRFTGEPSFIKIKGCWLEHRHNAHRVCKHGKLHLRRPSHRHHFKREGKRMWGEPSQGNVTSVCNSSSMVEGYLSQETKVVLPFRAPARGCFVISAYAITEGGEGTVTFTADANEEFMQYFSCVQPNTIPEQLDIDEDVESEEDNSVVPHDPIRDEGHTFGVFNLRPRAQQDDSDEDDSDNEAMRLFRQQFLGTPSRVTRDTRAGLTRDERKQQRQQRRQQRQRERENEESGEYNENTERGGRRGRGGRKNKQNKKNRPEGTHAQQSKRILSTLTDQGQIFCCKQGIRHKKASAVQEGNDIAPKPLECMTTPQEVTAYSSRKFSTEGGVCSTQYSRCCNEFDLEAWRAFQERRQQRRAQRAERRKAKPGTQ